MSKIKPSTIRWPEDWTMEQVGMSQSLWAKWLGCKRQFLLHINGYSQPLRENKVHFGNLCHHVCDKVFSCGTCPGTKQIGDMVDEYTEIRIKASTLLTQQELEMDATKAHAVMTVYFERYESDFKNKKFLSAERGFVAKFSGCTQRGKIDVDYLSNAKKWLMEHKTKGRINEDNILLRLPLDFQNLFYLLNDEIISGTLAEGVLYDVIRNPQLKIGKNESLRAFFARILETCRADHDHHFKRWESAYSKTDHSQFRLELARHIQELKTLTGHEVAPNRFNCDGQWTCEFLEACSKDSMAPLSKSIDEQLGYIFPELKEVNYGSKTNSRKVVKTAVRRK